jgi:hypothetical protein
MNKVCIVGSADSLIGKGLGEKIDSHDIIVRINQPQISGFEGDVGSRITHSFISPWQIAGWVPGDNVCAICTAKDKKRQVRREESIIREDCFNRLKLEDTGTIVLPSHPRVLNYNFHSFYKEINHLIDSKINFSFIQTFNTMKKWRKKGFARIPTNGTLIIEHYRKVYGNVDIAGFGHGSNERSDKFYHYWDTESNWCNHGYNVVDNKIIRDNSLPGGPHDINMDMIWLEKLHKKNKINILELYENNNTI